MNIALIRLMAGFRRFKEKYFLEDLVDHSIHSKLAGGQTPKTLLISCSDSRVDPAIMTGANPGELFVVRNVANLVPPCEPPTQGLHGTSSALEFAVVNLKVENIIILGHRQCGGIRALMDENPNPGPSFIGRWMGIAKEARENVLREHSHADFDTKCKFAERESIKVSIRNLLTFPFIKEAVEAKKLNIVGVYFDLEQGQLWEYDLNTLEFQQLPV